VESLTTSALSVPSLTRLVEMVSAWTDANKGSSTLRDSAINAVLSARRALNTPHHAIAATLNVNHCTVSTCYLSLEIDVLTNALLESTFNSKRVPCLTWNSSTASLVDPSAILVRTVLTTAPAASTIKMIT